MGMTIRLTVAILAGLLAATTAPAQIIRTNIYSRPELPSADVLKRLNLRLAWSNYVPLDGRRDRIIRVALEGKDMVVLTRSGQVVRMDAETGKVHWRVTAGKPYGLLPFVAANSRSVYVIANVELMALDRGTGRLKWRIDLPAGVSAGPLVDEKLIYVPTSTGRIYAFALPLVGVGAELTGDDGKTVSLVYGDRDRGEGLPKPRAEVQTNISLNFQPLQTPQVIFAIGREGRSVRYGKTPSGDDAVRELISYSINSEVRVPPGQYGDTTYVGADDGSTYAINLTTGRLRWRHTGGTPVTRRPVALEADVFITNDREGMARIDQRSGDSMWKIPCGRRIKDSNVEADEFLAANDRFVYAADRAGRLLILDRKRGVRLSMFDTTAFRVKIVNEVTDRLYLGAQDGLIVCLHDRDQKEPIRHRRKVEEAEAPLQQILQRKVKLAEGKPATLRSVLDRLRKQYDFDYLIVERLFRDADNPNIRDREVKTPALDDRPLRDLLERTLAQVNATYRVEGKLLVIVPAKGKPKDKK